MNTVRRRESFIEIVEQSTTLAVIIKDARGVKVIAFIVTGEKKNVRKKSWNNLRWDHS